MLHLRRITYCTLYYACSRLRPEPQISGFIPPYSQARACCAGVGSQARTSQEGTGSQARGCWASSGSQAPCSNQFDHETKWPLLTICTYSKWPKSQSRYHISPYDLSFAANYVSEFLAVIYYINWTGCVHIAYHTGWNIHVRSTKRKVSQNWRHHIDCSISS